MHLDYFQNTYSSEKRHQIINLMELFDGENVSYKWPGYRWAGFIALVSFF